MSHLHDLSGKVLKFISLSFLDGNGQLSVDTPLMDLNILDSASVFDLVDFLTSEFQVRVPLEEIHPDNFHSVLKLEELVTKLVRKNTIQ